MIECCDIVVECVGVLHSLMSKMCIRVCVNMMSRYIMF